MGAGPSTAGAYASGNMNGGIGGMMSSEGRWWEAFGTGGFEGEPSLMEGESILERQAGREDADIQNLVSTFRIYFRNR